VQIVGVDGGQSSTRCLVVDEGGSVNGHGCGGPSNHVQGEAGRRRLRSALQESLRGALPGEPPVPVDSIALGMTGIGKTLGKASLVETYTREFVSPRCISVQNDLLIALMGASIGEPGVMVYAGTGTHTYGFNERGEETRVGGWGHIIDDEGGAYDIGRQALKRAFRAEDGRNPPTMLREKLLRHFGCTTLAGVRNAIYDTDGFDRPQIAALSRLVGEAAAEGDNASVEILQTAGETLGRTAVVAARKIDWDEKPVIYYGGGVFAAGEPLITSFRDAIEREMPHVPIRLPSFPPVVGAVLAAFGLLGLRPDAPVLETIAAGVQRIGWDH